MAQVVVITLVCGAASTALAAKASVAPRPTTASSADTLARAEAECAALDYENCAETAMLVVVAADATPDERTRARWIAGSAQRVIGKDVDAKMNFRALIQDAPAFVPPDDTPAKVAQFFALVKAEVVNERGASPPLANGGDDVNLVVESVPVGAQVSLDGTPLGATPVHARGVRAGLHEIRVEGAPPGDAVVVPVDVFADGKTAVRVTFRASRAAVEKTRAGDRIVDEARGEELPTFAGALTKGVGSLLACGAGTCSGCIAFAGLLTLGNAVGLDSLVYSSLASGACSVLWLAGALGGAGFLGFALVDVVGMVESGGADVVHAVDVVPPKGRGAPRTLLFSVSPVAQAPDGGGAVAY